ncbi:YhgE/Pip domain-containing protein [Microbacterium indicum]|uniref:YhgE/Pip domain-containing protein n=1 Tax=Microbacterium indicum TaxID=358100 RepID=UPI0004016EB0|nr:YhgE/Pip domain-containing protein [Microbacterium indicum]
MKSIVRAVKGLEIKPFTLVVIAALSIVPLIYAGALVWSNEDPTHRLDTITAAIVNEDEGGTASDKTVNLGDELVDTLTESDSDTNFSWVEMSASEAKSGLDDGSLLVSLEIPKSFSADAVSAAGDDPSKATSATLTITTNDAANQIIGNMASTVGTAVSDALASKVSDEYLQNIYAGFTTIHGSMADAADGAGELEDGADQAHDGSGELVVGLTQLESGSSTLASGAQQLADGAATLSSGAQSLDSGIADAATGSQTLASGAASAATGAQSLADGLATMKDQTADLPAQTQKLADGAEQVSDATGQLSDAATGVADAAHEFVDGMTPIVDGAQKALDDAQSVLDGAGDLASSIPDLGTGATSVSDGLADLASGYDSMTDEERKSLIDQLAQSASSVSDATTAAGDSAAQLRQDAADLVGSSDSGTGLTSLRDIAKELGDEVTGLADKAAAGAKQLSDGATAVSDGAATLASKSGELADGIATASDGATALASGTQQVSDGAASLATGLGTAKTGADSLASGSATLASSAQQLADGANTLSDGTTTATDGAQTLDDGLGTLADGSATLADGLASGVDEVPSYTDSEAQTAASAASKPVTIDAQRLNEVPAYGYGLAPYFLSLALWVGALAFYLMMPPLRERLLRSRMPGWLAGLASFVPGAIMAVVQGLLMIAVVHLGLGIEVSNLPGLVGMLLLTGVAFNAINQALTALLGAPGRFIALIMIVLQLASAGATYPIQTTPGVFQTLHGLLPMTYTVEAIRSLIAGGSIGITQAVGVLSGWLIAALAATMLAATLKSRKERQRFPAELQLA